jgi:hypothetical protein
MRPTSWVVTTTTRDGRRVVLETFERRTAEKCARIPGVCVETVSDYLARLNAEIRAGKRQS